MGQSNYGYRSMIVALSAFIRHFMMSVLVNLIHGIMLQHGKSQSPGPLGERVQLVQLSITLTSSDLKRFCYFLFIGTKLLRLLQLISNMVLQQFNENNLSHSLCRHSHMSGPDLSNSLMPSYLISLHE